MDNNNNNMRNVLGPSSGVRVLLDSADLMVCSDTVMRLVMYEFSNKASSPQKRGRRKTKKEERRWMMGLQIWLELSWN